MSALHEVYPHENYSGVPWASGLFTVTDPSQSVEPRTTCTLDRRKDASRPGGGNLSGNALLLLLFHTPDVRYLRPKGQSLPHGLCPFNPRQGASLKTPSKDEKHRTLPHLLLRHQPLRSVVFFGLTGLSCWFDSGNHVASGADRLAPAGHRNGQCARLPTRGKAMDAACMHGGRHFRACFCMRPIDCLATPP